MSDTLKDTGVAIELDLKGNKYKLAPLSIGDLGEFDSYIKSEKIKTILATNCFIGEEKTKIALEILRTPLTNEEYSEANRSLSGIRFLVYKSMKHNLPDMAIEDMDLIIDATNMNYVLAMINGLSEVDTSKNPTEPKEASEKESSPSEKPATGSLDSTPSAKTT